MFVRTEPAHVSTIELGINRTPARVSFKKNAGQNNHFLITVLVGLDSVREGKAGLNDEFSTSWSPKDVERSALRSRDYALVTSLAWITDLIDVYRKRLQGMNSVFESAFSAKINAIEGRANRLSGVASALDISKTDSNLLLTLFAIKWRNTIVHSDAVTRVSSTLKAHLLNAADEISEAHRGMDVERSIAAFEQGHAPTFKEVASFISAAQGLVQAFDAAALAKMDIDKYAESTLSAYFSHVFSKNTQVFSQFWPGNPSKSHQRLAKLLTQCGFSEAPGISQLSSDYLGALANLTARNARSRFSQPPT
ncbi:hypothetical protein ABIE18_003660 [Arthrobacter sp. 2762]